MIDFFWKIYYWFIICVALVCLINFFTVQQPAGAGNINLFTAIYDLIFIILLYISIIGIRGNAYRKKYFSQSFWIFLVCLLIVEITGRSIYNHHDILAIFGKYYGLLLFLYLNSLLRYTFFMNDLWKGENSE